MEALNFESTQDFPCYVKNFLWIQNYLAAYSLFNDQFGVYDVLSKRTICNITSDCVYASFVSDEEKLYCGGFLRNQIDVFDLNKEKFENIYKNQQEEDKKSTYRKFYRNKDKTFVGLVQKSKIQSVVLFDVRQPNPLITEKSFPFNVTCSDISQNLLSIAWENKAKFCHSVIDLCQFWPNEKDFEHAMKRDLDEKLKTDDFDSDKKITAIRISPSKNMLSVGRENGGVYVYEMSEDFSKISQKTQISYAALLHPEEKITNSKEPGKKPERKTTNVVDLDFFPRNKVDGYEAILASSGNEGELKFLNLKKRKLVGVRKIDKKENRYFETVKWNPSGDVLMVLKSPEVESEETECQMKFINSPIKSHEDKNK